MIVSNQRLGVTILELMMAVAVVAMLMVALAGLSMTIQDGAKFNQGYGEAAQHARVVKARVTRTVNAATATEDYPGAIVVDETVGGWQFPDTLVVWSPETGNPAAATIGPLVSELVVYMPNPDAPNELWELTERSNTGRALSDTEANDWVTSSTLTGWKTTVASMVASPASHKVVLTDLLRIGSTSLINETGEGLWRGCLRFESAMNPARWDWDGYQGGSWPWEEISFAQGIRGSQTGLRQVWVRFEFQLQPGHSSGAGDSAVMPPLLFFGSAAIYYEMHR